VNAGVCRVSCDLDEDCDDEDSCMFFLHRSTACPMLMESLSM
jgi:hypothetical protein